MGSLTFLTGSLHSGLVFIVPAEVTLTIYFLYVSTMFFLILALGFLVSVHQSLSELVPACLRARLSHQIVSASFPRFSFFPTALSMRALHLTTFYCPQIQLCINQGSHSSF